MTAPSALCDLNCFSHPIASARVTIGLALEPAHNELQNNNLILPDRLSGREGVVVAVAVAAVAVATTGHREAPSATINTRRAPSAGRRQEEIEFAGSIRAQLGEISILFVTKAEIRPDSALEARALKVKLSRRSRLGKSLTCRVSTRLVAPRQLPRPGPLCYKSPRRFNSEPGPARHFRFRSTARHFGPITIGRLAGPEINNFQIGASECVT